MGKVVGIDLGTTFSAIAHVNDYAQAEIVPNKQNERTTPSVILFQDDNVVVGKIAKAQAKAMPEQIVEFVKREMGKQKGAGENEFCREFNGKSYSAEELSAQILLKLKQDAEAHLGTEITDAVITVPAYFKDAERSATRLAGEIAGLNVLQVVNEPTAAALAYGLDLQNSGQTVFVFDLGGGTFDVTIMKVSGSELRMIATDGDSRLGGKDWDDEIIKYVAEKFEIEHGSNPLDDNYTYQDIQSEAIQAKEHLTELETTRIVFNYEGKSSNVELTREKFEELTADLLGRCRATCEHVLSEAKMTWEDINTVLLVGGSTRMPMVRKMIAEISGKEINPTEVNLDEVVAHGAAIYGTLRQIEEVIIDKTSETATEEDISEAVKDKFINDSDETVIAVFDRATHNLGLTVSKTVDKKRKVYTHVMIPKMTPVPCEITRDSFGTLEDNQQGVLINVFQGLEHNKLIEEIPDFENHRIGKTTLKLPPNLPKGTPIKVTFEYNRDQTLEVTAEGPNNSSIDITIDRKTLNKEQVTEATTNLQENLKVK